MFEQQPQPGHPYQHHVNQPTGPVYLPPTPPPPPKKAPPTWALALTLLLMLGCVVGVVAVIATSIGGSDNDGGPSAVDVLADRVDQQPPLQRAVATCDPTADEPGIRSDQLQVGDEGRSVSIDGAGLASGPPIETVACVLRQIDVPDSVISRMDNTRALDGTQTAEWDDYWASWTYHPDDGLNVVIEQR
jgi:hypothetical protein